MQISTYFYFKSRNLLITITLKNVSLHFYIAKIFKKRKKTKKNRTNYYFLLIAYPILRNQIDILCLISKKSHYLDQPFHKKLFKIPNINLPASGNLHHLHD